MLLMGFIAFSFPAWGAEVTFDVSSSIDWVSAELYSQTGFELAQAGIRIPTGRFLGEEILEEAFPRLIRPYILSIKIDSSSAVRDMLERGEISLRALDSLSLGAEKTPPRLSPDLTRMNGNYTLSLEKVSALINSNRRAFEPNRPLIPVQTADYTGIIVIANEELAVHGRAGHAFAEPCLFPKIWDTEMNLIYARNMFEAGAIGSFLMTRYAAPESIFRPTPSGLEGELEALLGPRPLRILARGIFGISPTDPIIDREDALKILSSENNRRLLREGRVLLVLDERNLQASF